MVEIRPNKSEVPNLLKLRCKMNKFFLLFFGFNNEKFIHDFCRNPTLAKCEDETHTPKVGNLESSGIPECLEFDNRGKNTSHCSVHWSFGHLQPKSWAKEAPGVKLAV
jgi:hypothetical protein